MSVHGICACSGAATAFRRLQLPRRLGWGHKDNTTLEHAGIVRGTRHGPFLPWRYHQPSFAI
ncbi:hypothetical protein SFRURICE_002933 [Spodoptera frugiperda]|uniref:SFRICE_000118 n=1 Tax=Spodoptera frugiperda TaxID=7108 RepID=A0A2H1W1D5_SPOFR|nr:hypothetical protein SFRURICE_002933 [Spodoptera frugiperda]